jgi:hypothetical protein
MTGNTMTKEKGQTVKHWFTIHYTEINEWAIETTHIIGMNTGALEG